MNLFHLIGYLGSGLVATGLMMSSIIKLRLFSLGGAICFVIYGLLIRAYPVAMLNTFIILIHLYHLHDAFTAKEYFKLLAIQPQSEYLSFFLEFYAAEIKKFLPDFSYSSVPGQWTFLVLRDLVPAGLFIAAPYADGALLIKIDFVIPGYRDFKVGQFLFAEKAALFKEQGIGKIFSEPGTPKHEGYLQRMGFVPDNTQAEENLYSLTIG